MLSVISFTVSTSGGRLESGLLMLGALGVVCIAIPFPFAFVEAALAAVVFFAIGFFEAWVFFVVVFFFAIVLFSLKIN